MCESKTELIFGIVVKKWSLYVASEAHLKLKDRVGALDAIISRWKKGTLVVEGAGLPLEIYEMIRLEVIDFELLEAEKRILAPLFWPSYCSWTCGLRRPSHCQVVHPREGGKYSIYAQTEYDEMLWDLWYNFKTDSKISSQNRAFLAHYGLDLREATSTIADEAPYGAFNLLLTAIVSSNRARSVSNNSQTTSDSTLSMHIQHGFDGGDRDYAAVAYIDPSVFTSPWIQYDSIRLRKLFRDYRLDLVDSQSPSKTIYDQASLPVLKPVVAAEGEEEVKDIKQVGEKETKAQKDKREKEEKEKEEKERPRVRVEPRWMMWKIMCHYCG